MAETTIDEKIDILSGAEVCFLMASTLLYQEPTVEGITDQRADKTFVSAPFGMDNDQVKKGLALMESWCESAPTDAAAFDEAVSDLKREWFRLFVGAGTPDAPSWEGYYVDPNSQIIGVNTLAVRRWYQKYGLQIENLNREPDDNLGLMLGFLAHLIGCEADALTEGDTAKAEEISADIDAFLTEHILPWITTWHYDVEKHATSDYFRGVGDLVFGFCEAAAAWFGIHFDATTNSFKRGTANELVS